MVDSECNNDFELFMLTANKIEICELLALIDNRDSLVNLKLSIQNKLLTLE